MRALPLIFLLVLAAGCGGEPPAAEPAGTAPETAAETAPLPPPTTEEAKELVAESAAFGDFRFSTESAFSLPLDTARFNEPARQGAEDLAKAGWIRMSSGRVELAKGEGDRRFLVRPNGFVDIVPLAKKELLDVTDVRAAGESVEVDFTWRWVPNDVGAAFTRGAVAERFAGERRATATLQDFGAGWDVLSIAER